MTQQRPVLGTSPAVESGTPDGNRILLGLAAQERVRLRAALQPVTFALGDVIFEQGRRIEHVYFPTTAVVSSLYTTEEGATAEMSLAGNDGVVGVSSFLGSEDVAHRAVAVVGGEAFRMKARALREAFATCRPLQSLLLRYTQALLMQISQTAVCNRLHAVEQRLCRWLLMCHDRVEADDLRDDAGVHLEHARRPPRDGDGGGGRLQDAGLIRYSRGHITILNRGGLEAAVCECYPRVETECERLCADVAGGGMAGAAGDR